MAGQKFWAHGMGVTFDSVAIGGIESVEGPSDSTDSVETTDTDSGGVEESVAGLSRPGNVTINCRKIPGDTGQDALKTASDNKTIGEVIITLPASATDDSTTVTITFDAWVTSANQSFPGVENTPATITFELKKTGTHTEAIA